MNIKRFHLALLAALTLATAQAEPAEVYKLELSFRDKAAPGRHSFQRRALEKQDYSKIAPLVNKASAEREAVNVAIAAAKGYELNYTGELTVKLEDGYVREFCSRGVYPILDFRVPPNGRVNVAYDKFIHFVYKKGECYYEETDLIRNKKQTRRYGGLYHKKGGVQILSIIDQYIEVANMIRAQYNDYKERAINTFDGKTVVDILPEVSQGKNFESDVVISKDERQVRLAGKVDGVITVLREYEYPNSFFEDPLPSHVYVKTDSYEWEWNVLSMTQGDPSLLHIPEDAEYDHEFTRIFRNGGPK